MKNYRRTAIAIGILYILGTVFGVLSVVFSKAVIVETPDLTALAAQPGPIVTSAMFILLMALVLAFIPILFTPLAVQLNQFMAYAFLVFRGALETVGYMLITIGTLMWVPVSTAASADADLTSVMIHLMQGASNYLAELLSVAFIIGGVFFYLILYRYKLVPRWLPAWGLLSLVPYLTASLLIFYGLNGNMNITDTLLRMPLALQEMVLAVWLIAKGFKPESLPVSSKTA